MQELKNLIDDAVDIRGFGIEALGTDGAKKLCDDVVEARDLAAGNKNRLLEFGAEFWRSLLQMALHELKVDVERVEGIPDFMGNTGSQHGEGGEFFDFDRLLRVAMGLCDVTKDDRTTDRLGFVSIALVAQQGNHIKIQKAVIRIKDFEVAANNLGLRTAQGLPVDTSHHLGQGLPEACIGFNTEKTTRSPVEVKNAALGVGDNDTFKNRVENGLEKSLLAGDFNEVILHLARLNERKAVDEFVEESAFHGSLKFSTGSPVPARQNARNRARRDDHCLKFPIHRMAGWMAKRSWEGFGKGCRPAT